MNPGRRLFAEDLQAILTLAASAYYVNAYREYADRDEQGELQ